MKEEVKSELMRIDLLLSSAPAATHTAAIADSGATDLAAAPDSAMPADTVRSFLHQTGPQLRALVDLATNVTADRSNM